MKALSALFLLLLSSSASGAVNIMNMLLLGDSISFDIKGTIDEGVALGGNAPDGMFIGTVTSGSQHWVDFGAVGTIINNSAEGIVDFSSAASASDSSRDYISLYRPDGVWQVGDSVDASITIVGGVYQPEEIIIEDIKVTVGFTLSIIPNADYIVGGYIPEPSTYALLFGMASLAVAARRRQ